MYDLTIYTSGEETIPIVLCSKSKLMAAKILAEAGVRIRWSRRAPPEGRQWRAHGMTVEFRAEMIEPQGGSVASASPYEGSKVTILYSRMKWAESQPELAPKLLAHTLAHEIAHNLQAIARHSATGIMKARWTASDYYEMSVRQLHFEPVDIELICKGLNKRLASPHYRRCRCTFDWDKGQ